MEFTTKVIDLAKLTPEQVKVVCSVSGDNGENNQRKLGKDYPIGQPSDPVKKINFYTSTCFEGCDIYDENGVTFIVSDGNKSHTLLDISTLFTQICGRLRDSKYKGEIIHVYSTTKYSRDVTLDEFVASTKKVLAEAVSYADEINKLSDTAREKTLSKIKYINEQYVRIEDNRLIVDKNLANMDIVNFKICRHIYRTYVNLTNELQRNGYTITRHTFSEIMEKIENKTNARVTFKDLFDEYHRLKTTKPFFSLENHEDLCAQIAVKYPLVKQAYDELGTDKVQALKYHKYRFYDEREFRSVPRYKELKKLHPTIQPYLSEKDYQDYKRKHKNTLIKTLKLSFEWEDIRYIVVKRKQDIKTISELLQNLAPDIHPQIFTTQQILEDVIGCNHNRQLSISDAK